MAMLPSGDVRSTWEQKQQHYGAMGAQWLLRVLVLAVGTLPVEGIGAPWAIGASACCS